jgi:kynureninase
MIFCHHIWDARAIEHGLFVFGGGGGTTVLYVCPKCGDSKTESLNGWWTLEQLRRDAPPP